MHSSGVLGRIEVEAHDVDDRGLQLWIGGEAKALAAQGWILCSCQIRVTVVSPMPSFLSKAREDQCVSLVDLAGGRGVAAITRAASAFCGRPGRARSVSPFSPYRT